MNSANAADSSAAKVSSDELTTMPLESLLNMEVATASKLARQITDAPSAVSIVTSRDIHDYGYRTLADILKSMSGLYMTNDLVYQYLGGRGFGEPSDYAGRIMLTIDGNPTGDGIWNQIFFGNDALLDVELIDRVEFVPGPGSVNYGNGAFLGVINITTKKGKDFKGGQVALGLGSHNTNNARITWGKELENGADVLFSASGISNSGRDIYMQALDSPSTNSGNLSGQDKSSNHRVFFKGHYENWSVEVANVRRYSNIDSSINWNSGYNDPSKTDFGLNTKNVDDSTLADLKYDADLSRHLKSSSRFYYGQYLYKTNYYDSLALPTGTAIRQIGDSRWMGFDNKFIGSWFEQHKLLFGFEYRQDYRQVYADQSYAADRFNLNTSIASLYAQDEYSLTDQIKLNFGVRYDRSNSFGDALSPRTAIIYNPRPETTFKFSSGTAFSFQNTSEFSSNFQRYRPETVKTTEFVWQEQLTPRSRLMASYYHYKITDAILQMYSDIHTVGQSIEYEALTTNDWRLRTSLAHQETEDNTCDWRMNSPRWLAKFNFAKPILNNLIMAGFEAQFTSRRLKADMVTTVPNATTANLTLSSDKLVNGFDVIASVRNLFDQKIWDVAADPNLGAYPQDGINFWLQVSRNFK